MAHSPQRFSVLVTRAESSRISADLEQRGFAPIIAPLLRVRPHHPPLPHAVQAILVTSGNALHAITPWPVPLLAVGDATAARARDAGFTTVHSAGRDGAALVALAATTLRPDAGPVLLLSGAGQGGAVAAGLRQAGFRVIRRVTYTAAPVRRFPPEAASALAAGTLHAAIFLSGETAATFVRLLPPALQPHLRGVVAVAIGKPAADALKPLPWRQVRLARTPTLDDVLALL
jgi:uroporphyrinogen-III synthase